MTTVLQYWCVKCWARDAGKSGKSKVRGTFVVDVSLCKLLCVTVSCLYLRQRLTFSISILTRRRNGCRWARKPWVCPTTMTALGICTALSVSMAQRWVCNCGVSVVKHY